MRQAYVDERNENIDRESSVALSRVSAEDNPVRVDCREKVRHVESIDRYWPFAWNGRRSRVGSPVVRVMLRSARSVQLGPSSREYPRRPRRDIRDGRC